MARQLNRRVFLRGLGGACVAAPFLESIAPRGAKAQSAAAPQRLIVMFTHYGCVTNRFFPAKSHGALTAADLEATSLKPLAPYVSKLLIPRGIRAMNQWSPTMDLGQGNDTHFHVGSFFTCQPITPNSDSPFGIDGTSSRFPPKPVGPSLDHVMARQISPQGQPLLISVANQTDSGNSTISYSEAETVFRGQRGTQVYQTLTGLFQSGAPVSPDSYQAARGKSIVDLVRGDLDTLARFDMSRDDRQKLEAWKTLLDETGRVMPAACGPETAAALGLTQENISAATGGLDGDALTRRVEGTSLDGADVYSNLAVLAALCNANPVIFLKYPANFVFKGLGLTLESHSLSHRLDNASMAGPCVPGVLDMLLKIDDFYARKFARLVEMLNSFDEGSGKVLDNTATVWFQEQSDGAAHNLNNLPIVQAGGAGGYFKTGWAVNVDDGSATLSTGNSQAFCTGAEADEMINGTQLKTGTDPALANAPINKYFCNLMNALGVKAGADGFPALGGAAEVTRFGMYDKTQDFIGGGTNPPTIHDPGEFSALRANA